MTDENYNEADEIRKGLDKLNLIRQMTQTPGWVLLKKHFEDVLVAITEKLLEEEDVTKFSRLQERHRAFRSMLETADSMCKMHSSELLRLEIIETDNNERDQYGQK